MRKRTLKTWVFVFLAAALVAFAAVPIAQSAIYSTTYYNIYYYNTTQYNWAKALGAYLNRAFWAAKTTIGYDARVGKMNIYFYSKADGSLGYMYGGQQNIYLNRYYFTTYDKWGSVTAHESAHVLFYNYTKANYWNSNLIYYRTFLTEALSWYAGDYVYNYSKYTSSSAYSQIRSNLKYYYGLTKTTISWYGSGYYYKVGTSNSNLSAQNIWQLRAIGYYLTGGRLTTSSPYVQQLLYAMKVYSSYAGSYLRSATYSTARSYFEYSFKYAYGRYANAGWIYTGSSNGAYKNTAYLYGSFWYSFYN